MERQLEPEGLDFLDPADPIARASRAELFRVNRVMGTSRLLTRALRRAVGTRPPRVLLDLGSGDGRVAVAVARRLAPHWPGVHLVLVDRQPAVEAATLERLRPLGWTGECLRVDIADAGRDVHWPPGLDAAPDDVVFMANLFLHHLDDATLRGLFARIGERARAFVTCEPRRDALTLAASRLVVLLGANHVTRRDAVLSVRSGFRDRDLTALWPADPPGDSFAAPAAAPRWQVEEGMPAPFTHRFIARRVDGADAGGTAGDAPSGSRA